MKRKMFALLMSACVAMIGFTSCDKEDDNDIHSPGVAFEKALTDKYPGADRVEWEKKGNYFVADFRIDGKEKEVWFDMDAKWKMTETDLLYVDLPATVTTAHKAGEYGAWRVDDVDMLEYAEYPTLYVIEVEESKKEIQLFYTTDGELVDAKDVTNSNDSHLPTFIVQ